MPLTLEKPISVPAGMEPSPAVKVALATMLDPLNKAFGGSCANVHEVKFEIGCAMAGEAAKAKMVAA